jgi:hypothetical protein
MSALRQIRTLALALIALATCQTSAPPGLQPLEVGSIPAVFAMEVGIPMISAGHSGLMSATCSD